MNMAGNNEQNMALAKYFFSNPLVNVGIGVGVISLIALLKKFGVFYKYFHKVSLYLTRNNSILVNEPEHSGLMWYYWSASEFRHPSEVRHLP